jgi:GNAT superfamily N-acetyltransferase
MSFTCIPDNNQELRNLLIEELNRKPSCLNSINTTQGVSIIYHRKDSEIIGMMTFHRYTNEKIIEIHEFKIHEDYRRRKFGTQLMKFFLNKVKQEKCTINLTCDIKNEVGRKFYKTLNFYPKNSEVMTLKYSDFPC